MNTNHQIPATQNEAWGFWGTMNEHASAAWPLAMTAISDATSQPLESVGSSSTAATDATLRTTSRTGCTRASPGGRDQRRHPTWMGWTIGRQTSKQYGIPRGLPYLTGFVIHCEIAEEVALIAA
jgi:hypothetical protein